MVRISIPTLPVRLVPFVNPLSTLTVQTAAAKVASFLQQGRGRTLVITGAGISVDSGIRAYRGDDG
jgi:NAD-dependent deacetylase sirtuin 4